MRSQLISIKKQNEIKISATSKPWENKVMNLSCPAC